MNINEICNELVKILPFYKEKINIHKEENNNEFLGHVFFEDIFLNNLIFLIMLDIGEIHNKLFDSNINEIINLIKNDKYLLQKHCDFIEYMWENGDDYVINIVDVSILEGLSVDMKIWKRFGTIISNEFKDYINKYLLKNNIMMNDNITLDN